MRESGGELFVAGAESAMTPAPAPLLAPIAGAGLWCACPPALDELAAPSLAPCAVGGAGWSPILARRQAPPRTTPRGAMPPASHVALPGREIGPTFVVATANAGAVTSCRTATFPPPSDQRRPALRLLAA